jgi:hypothetical protein
LSLKDDSLIENPGGRRPLRLWNIMEREVIEQPRESDER